MRNATAVESTFMTTNDFGAIQRAHVAVQRKLTSAKSVAATIRFGGERVQTQVFNVEMQSPRSGGLTASDYGPVKFSFTDKETLLLLQSASGDTNEPVRIDLDGLASFEANVDRFGPSPRNPDFMNCVLTVTGPIEYAILE